MKKFNLEDAVQGAKLFTRSMKPARLVCFDVQNPKFPLIALITEEDGTEVPVLLNNNGRASGTAQNTENDLFIDEAVHGFEVTLTRNSIGKSDFADSEQTIKVFHKVRTQEQVGAIKDIYIPKGFRVEVESIEWEE